MHKITVVFTAHRENGLCNVGELIKILRSVGPEVVFEETRPSDFDAYYKHGTMRKLESEALKKYSEDKDFKQIPVDRYEAPLNLLIEIKSGFDRVLEYVEQTSQEYVELNEENAKRQFEDGFAYLNSDACTAVMERVAAIEDAAISETGDGRLSRGLKAFRDLMQRRESEMIGNIYEYCRGSMLETAVFLVGAAHKAGMTKEIEKHAGTEKDLIEWTFTL